MRAFSEPYSKYGLALVMSENEIETLESISEEMVLNELHRGLNSFRLQPSTHATNTIKFNFIPFDELKNNKNLVQKSGLASEGKYLAPNIVVPKGSARNIFKKLTNTVHQIQENKNLNGFTKSEKLTKSYIPYSSKTNQGKKSQSAPKTDQLEAIFCLITNSTPIKPCLAIEGESTCIIPDLSIEKLRTFISLFDKMRTNVEGDLLQSELKDDEFRRPKIFNGNFSNPPKSYAFGTASLLGSIGNWAKEAELTPIANEVLDSLKKTPLYIINSDKVRSVSFTHYIVELAKNQQLHRIVGALEGTRLFSDNKKAYQQFIMMASRFLQLFNKPAFQSFLSYRAQYQPYLVHLLNTYFMEQQKIPSELVTSAKELGRWLNKTAYIAAKEEIQERGKESKDDLYKAKAKALAEIESSAFSAKSGSALLAKVVTRAGRLTGMDAPAEASDFMEATANGTLDLDDSKNLLIAFSRLRHQETKSATKKPSSTGENEYSKDSDISE